MTHYKILVDNCAREEFFQKICEEIDKLGDSFVTVNITETFPRCEAILFYKEETLAEEKVKRSDLIKEEQEYLKELRKSCDMKWVVSYSSGMTTDSNLIHTLIMSKPDSVSRYIYIDYSGTYPGGKLGDYYYYSTKYKCMRKLVEDQDSGIQIIQQQSYDAMKEAEKKSLVTDGKKKLSGRGKRLQTKASKRGE